ncbi:MAG: helix-turn-helix domain-containing protein [Streptosporangiales bacterium]|nr:helix-turn-helix domain-containing protein [Streptosporangiales bacterium]MBO0889379.1 helix-turn-helix domain-containing protein [Acidothermales bacterium]
MAEDQQRRLPQGFDPERDVMLDVRSLRGIAHPLRTRLLGLLRADGPSTATKLAGRLGLSSAATSYHLRQLAAYGFVAEEEGRGKTRERWWRAAHRSTVFDRSALVTSGENVEEVDALSEEYLRSVIDVYARSASEYLDIEHRLPEEWRDAGDFSDTLLSLTPDEARRLAGEIDAVLHRYRRRDAPDQPAAARPVRVQYQVFPRFDPDAEAGE